MKKVLIGLGMMMIATTMALPAFAGPHQPEDSSKTQVMTKNSQPCCPGWYQEAKEDGQKFVDAGQNEVPEAALR